MAEIIPDSNKQAIPGFVTQKATSSQGQEYEVGRPEGSEESDQAQPDSGVPPFSRDVTWSAGSFGSTTGDIEWQTGITYYHIETGGFFYKYRLNFTTQQPFNYAFTDESNDVYHVNCYQAGNHYVDYNSSHPNITHVSGP